MELLEESYLKWLYGQVADPEMKDPARNYWLLLGQLHSTPFVHIIQNDRNRVMDGLALREEFIQTGQVYYMPSDWMDFKCSVLELVFAMSRRLAFSDLNGGSSHYWFWKILDNLGFMGYTDAALDGYDSTDLRNDIDITLRDVMFRVYSPSGRGGFFPLKHTQWDQREVELWYQMAEYVLEQ